MPPFSYQTFQSPYANTIAQLLAHQGDPQAIAAQQVAAANARAGEIAAQAWGGVAKTVGDSISHVGDTIAREQEIAPKLALEKIQVQQAQREQSAQAAQASLLQNDQLPPGTAGPQRQSLMDDNGFLDPGKVGARYAAMGFGDKVPDLLHAVGLQNQAMRDYDASTKQVATDKTIMQGIAAHGTLLLMQNPMIPIDEAIDQATGAPVQTGRMSAADVAKFKARILTLPPEQQQAVLVQMKQDAAQLGPKTTDKEGDITHDMFGGVFSKGGDKPITRMEAGVLATDPTKTPAQREAAAAALKAAFPQRQTPPTPKSYQKSSVLLDGKPAEVLLDPSPGGKVYDLNSVPIENAAQRVKPIPPPSLIIHNDQQRAIPMPAWALDDTRPIGDDKNVLDPNIHMTPNGLHQAALNYIANGQFPPTGRGSDPVAVAQRSAITSKVGAIADAAGMDEPTLRAFYKSNGQSLTQQLKMQDTVQGFMATADKNAALLEGTLKKIPDTGIPVFNQPLRDFASKVTGDPNLSQLAVYLQSVRTEYGKIITQPSLTGVLTDSARHETETLVSDDATVQQMLASLQALKAEGGNRLQSVGEQIQRIQQRTQDVTKKAPDKPAPGAGPDLSGLLPGRGRTFSSGPYAGQTWATGPDGQPTRVK